MTVLEIVLQDAESHIVQRERPAAQPTLGSNVQYLVGIEHKGGTARVEEHVRG